MKDVTREQRCRVFEGIIWVWLTGGRVGLNLLEEPFHQHWRKVSDNIPRGGKQGKRCREAAGKEVKKEEGIRVMPVCHCEEP
jgi:hypothetical protein